MLDTAEFARMRERTREEDERREKVIKRSRDILKESKRAIYALHRSAMEEAQGHLKDARGAANELLLVIAQHPSLRDGSFSAAMAEYAEAQALRVFLAEGRLVTLRELEILTPEEYLLGIADLAGELQRHAVHKATQRDAKAVQLVRDLLDALLGELMQFDFRNSELRRKYDSVKYALQKCEQILYELSA